MKQRGPDRIIAEKRVFQIDKKGPLDQGLKSFVSLYAANHTNMGQRNGYITIPFLTTHQMSAKDLIVDKYYNDIRRIYHFDKSCCMDVPNPDESVFHFRNFIRESGRLRHRAGYEELAPEQVANELFAHLNPGDKVAIASRFSDDFRTQMIVDALEKRQLRVRVTEPRSGVADFCFLLYAQKELVGTAKSSFFIWAGLLGNATRVRPYTAMISNGNSTFNSYNYTHSDLKYRFHFERYYTNTTAADLNKQGL